MAKRRKTPKIIETITHDEASRKNIPTAEFQSVMRKEEQTPFRVAYERRNRDLDPQLVWRGKDEQDWSDLVVNAPPLYIQEKVHPKALIDDLRKETEAREQADNSPQMDLFADFNGLPSEAAKTEFYQHDANWSNRMILGDSLQVMASLAEREGLRGKVQCIYFDPPYGIKFNSNFQWSTTSRDVKDGKVDHITREPEQVKAFRDTWRDGIHSYLTYLRDRLTVARDLLTDSGSIFVQIGDENVHRVRALMDEVFGDENFVSQILFRKTGGLTANFMPTIGDYLLWYGKNKNETKFRRLFKKKNPGEPGATQYTYFLNDDHSIDPLTESDEKFNIIEKLCAHADLTSQGNKKYDFIFQNKKFRGGFKPPPENLKRLCLAGRTLVMGRSIRYIRKLSDYNVYEVNHLWEDVGISGFADPKLYVVQTSPFVVQRCILMATDPGDLVLDPTCGSGTTAYVAEQWGRRWITIDTSRVAQALARARIMGARYPYYLLADSREGQIKEAEISRTIPSETPTYNDIRQGFVYQRVPHITLKSIANNAEIDVIWERFEERLRPLREQLTQVVGERWLVASRENKNYDVELPKVIQEWEVPREPPPDWPPATHPLITAFWRERIERQKAIDASIAAKADYEYLYDKPYEAKKKVRVAGPFTVDSLSPHRVLGVDEDDEFVNSELGIVNSEKAEGDKGDFRNSKFTIQNSGEKDFADMVLENLKTAGVQQAHKEDKINFTSITPWPGHYICAEGRYEENSELRSENSEMGEGETVDSKFTIQNSQFKEKRAAIFVGPEFGTVSRPDLVAAAREAGDAGFDVLIACAFNYDAHSSEFDKLGRIPVLKARMNADLHMADDLKNTGKGNLFVIFGEPDIIVVSEEWLVDSSGKRIVPYEIFKIVSGVDSLAEVNSFGREDLQSYARISCRGEVWDYLTDAAGGDINSGKYSRGAGSSEHGGISSVSWHCARFPGGTGNLSDFILKLGISEDSGFRELIERLRRDQQNAPRTDKIPLGTLRGPLSTKHYSQVTIHGVDVFHPNTGEVRSDGAEGIACWFIDTDYNEESFFVRHAYFLGANDPYKSLKTTLKAEINQEAWDTLHSDISRPFDKPESGRIAVKVINHLGDEVMKVFRVK